MDFERGLILKEIRHLKEIYRINRLGTEPSCFETKNSDKSLVMRTQANELFAKTNHNAEMHEEIWELYTKSIAYAPSKSKELGVGYANRSSLLLHLKKYNDCLLDIDRTLKVTNSNALKVKSYCRQSECYLALHNGKENISLVKAKLFLERINDDSERMKLIKMIEKTKQSKRNSDVPDSVGQADQKEKYDMPCENNAFRINYSEKYGKHLIADRDISMGEFLYVEKFYVASVNRTKSYAYCSLCLAISWALIPCHQCSFEMYCSEKCKKEAWQKYHDMECLVKFAKSPQDHTGYIIQLALKALLMGFKETGSIAKLKELTNEIDECTDLEKRGLTADGKFSSDSFRGLYSLNHSVRAERVEECVPGVLTVLVLLARNTNIFGEDFEYTNNIKLLNIESAIFVASLLLRLSTIFFVNVFEVTSANLGCAKGKQFFECLMKFCCSRGFSLSLFTSLINHSCDNNVDKFYTNDGRVVYYAVRPIEKNSQIFSSYYCKFFKMDQFARQKILFDKFEFYCECEACKNNWPNYLYGYTLNLIGADFLNYMKHQKLFAKLKRRVKPRFRTETIRLFIQEVEKFLKNYERPEYVVQEFLWALRLIIEHEYFVILEIPSTCG